MVNTKKTKIVCTLGPSTDDVSTLEQLIYSGMNVARFNFSHGNHEEQLKRMNLLKQARDNTGINVGMLIDTKGPEIRTHLMKPPYVDLLKGNTIRIAMNEVEGTAEKFSITYPELIKDVQVGDHVLLDDGLIDLKITEIDEDKQELVTLIVNSGHLKSSKGVNIPNVSLNLPGITQRDREDIIFAVQNDIDFIAASFIRSAADVLEIRELLEELGHKDIWIISKIENQEGVDNLEEILEVSDGIMVARGDLGVEIPTEEVPIIQKEIIRLCNKYGKPVITATQMLDSMQENPRPTRAEANDVANAIFDGTDAVMLSGETAAGDYPVEAVITMASICMRIENSAINYSAEVLKNFDKTDLAEAIGQAVGHTAKNLGIQTIVAATASGHTALMIAKYRPQAQVLAATPDIHVIRRLALVWGVQPYLVGVPKTTDEMLDTAAILAKEKDYAAEGDLIIITAGVPVGETGTTNIMKIQLIGTHLLNGEGIGRNHYVGKSCVVHSAEEANDKLEDGGILVTPYTDKTFMPAIKRAGALVVETGGITSHAAIVGLELGIPVIVNATDATKLIPDREVITVDARRGRIYKGATVSI